MDKAIAPTKLLIADDHPIVLDGVCALLRDLEVEIVARCRNGEQVLAEVARSRPELLLLDVQMPGLTGLDVLKRLRMSGDPTPVILLTASLSSAEAIEAIQLGVNGLVLKESAPRQLLQCVESVRAGERWLDPEATQRALDYATQERNGSPAYSVLTPREQHLARLITHGLRNKEIASEMSITEGTVKMHLHNIYEKLGVGSRTELAIYAKNNGIN